MAPRDGVPYACLAQKPADGSPGRFVRLAAIGLICLFAANVSSAWAGSAVLKCDDRASDLDRKIVACRNAGTFYAMDKDGWRDGSIVELRDFTHIGERGKAPSPVTYYLFTEGGRIVEGKYALLYDLKGGANAIGPDNSFTGRLTIDVDRLPDRHYKILFRISVNCDATSTLHAPHRTCSNNRPPVELPVGFYADSSGGPPELLTVPTWTRYEFASVEVEVRPANERPAPDTSGFRLTCQDPLCREGSPFAFTSGGLFRELREGGTMGCIMFRRKGKDSRVFGNAESKQLFDEKGMPSIVRNGGLSGKGSLPGAGIWSAALECLPGAKSVHLGEITVAGKPDVPPVKETVEPAIEVTLSPPRGDQEPGFTMPETGTVYAGSRLLTDLPKEVTYVSGMESSSATLAAGGPAGNSCGLRIRRAGSRTVQMLGNDRWLEGSLRFAGPSAVPIPPIRVTAKVPAELGPGRYTAELLCPQAVHSGRKRGNRLSATTGADFEVKAPRRPSARLAYPASPPTGNRHIDAIRRCGPCNGDTYSLEIAGLEAGDEIVAAKWTEGAWQGGDPRGSCRLAFPKIAFQCAASGDSASFSGTIPAGYDTDSMTRHKLDIRLRDRQNHFYVIPGQDIAAEPEPGYWAPGYGWPRGEFNFHRPCPGFANNARPEITRITGSVRLGGTLEVQARNFECSLRDVAVKLKGDAPFPLETYLENATTGADGNLSARLSLSGLDPEWAKAVTAPVPSTIVLRSYAGREASAQITLLPAIAITVTPDRPAAGTRIVVSWVGFRSNAGAKLYLDGGVLKDNILLDKADPSFQATLPEGLAGRRRLKLVDSANNAAEIEIDIVGEGGKTICREPCIQLPKSAKQGEPIDAYIGGFLRNEQLVVNFGGLFEVGKLHQESALVRQPIRVPSGVIDGRYRVSVAAVSDPARTAGDELDVRGGYRQPTLRVTCPRGQPDCDVPRFKPGESVNTTGMGWIVKGRFEATLISERGKQAVPMRTDGCVWGILGDTPAGKPCDEVQGEIDKFWVLPMDAAGGGHIIEVTDGMAVARADLWIEAGQAPDPKPPPEPKPPPAPRPDPAPGPAPKVCNPDLPRLWQPGCVPGPQPAPKPEPVPKPAPEPPPGPGPLCDPNRPRYAQPGCVEPEQPKGDGSTPSPRKCNPNVPRYTQPGCIP